MAKVRHDNRWIPSERLTSAAMMLPVGNSPDEPGLVSLLMTGGRRRLRKSELWLPSLVQRLDYMVPARSHGLRIAAGGVRLGSEQAVGLPGH